MATGDKISLTELVEKFPDEQAATEWFESLVWPNGRFCPRCKSTDTYEGTHKTMPYRCRTCNRTFSVRTNTILESSKVPLKKWAWAIYLKQTHPKGITSVRLGEYIGVTQTTAWFMLHRLRLAMSYDDDDDERFEGPVETDETFIGGLEKNKHAKKRLRLGGGGLGKFPIVGMRDRYTGKIRARVIDQVNSFNLSAFISRYLKPGRTLYTDENTAYAVMGGRYRHRTVNHSRGQYVCGDVHTNGIESFWAICKRTYKGTHHWISRKHLPLYVAGLVCYHNMRSLGTLERMSAVVQGMVGKRLLYAELTA